MQKRVIGGVMLILAFVFALISATTAIFLGTEAEAVPFFGDALADICYVIGIIELIFGTIGLLGGVMAITGKSWGIALVGGIFAMLSVGWWFLGFVFGLVGLIIIAISKDEFGPQAPPPAMAPAYGFPPPGAPPYPGMPPEQPPMQPPMEQPPMTPPPAEPPMEEPPASPPAP